MGSLEILLAYLLLGAFAGTMAGMLGVGGGLIIVPILVAVWQPEGIGGAYIMQMAIGTSLATIVFTSFFLGTCPSPAWQCAVGYLLAYYPRRCCRCLAGRGTGDTDVGRGIEIHFWRV